MRRSGPLMLCTGPCLMSGASILKYCCSRLTETSRMSFTNKREIPTANICDVRTITIRQSFIVSLSAIAWLGAKDLAGEEFLRVAALEKNSLNGCIAKVDALLVKLDYDGCLAAASGCLPALSQRVESILAFSVLSITNIVSMTMPSPILQRRSSYSLGRLRSRPNSKN